MADIQQAEISQRRQVLGKDFYDLLLSSATDYSGTPEYEKGTTYVDGDVVFFGGTVYQANKTTAALPSYKEDWLLAQKFADSDLEKLWTTFLGRYLSLIVVKNSMAPAATKIKSGNIVRVDGEQVRGADETERAELATWLSAQIKITFDNMHDFILENRNVVVYQLYKGLEGLQDDEITLNNDAQRSDKGNYWAV